MNTTNFHHVSPAYAKRFQHPDETEEQYVERLRQELEDKFIELGPDTVVGCLSILFWMEHLHIDLQSQSWRRQS